MRSPSEQGRLAKKQYVSLVALSLLSLQAAALELAKHPQVFDAGQGLLDELRFERAKALLGEAQWPVYRIAEVLGFSETASFRHAFQRWSGVPPSRFRA